MITTGLCILIGWVSYLCFQDREKFNALKHQPYLEDRNGSYYRWITAGFVHGDWMHLLINLFVFYSFGQQVEWQYQNFFGHTLGTIFYLALFFISVVGANVATFFKHKENLSFASVGASGGVSGVMMAYVIFQPWNKLYLYGIIGIPGIVAAIAYIGYSYYSSTKRLRSGIDHDAHMHGAIIGFLYTIILKPFVILPHFINQLMNVQF